MIWLRAGLIAIAAVVILFAVAQTAAPPPAAPDPTPAAAAGPTQPPPPTRVPLPTAPPQMIVSRISRQTPEPRATSTPELEPHVSVVDNGYLPSRIQVRAGDSVVWTNSGSDGHDVTGNGPGGAWRSGPLAPAEHYERQFPLAGTYTYACTIHPEMRGEVLVVQP